MILLSSQSRGTVFGNCPRLLKYLCMREWQLGLPRAVYRTDVIQQDDFLNSLYRMKSELNNGITDAIRAELAGSALAITG